MQKQKKVLLISLDALSSTEISIISNLPNFKKIMENGAYCPEEYSVFPSLTFPAHASIATGCYPKHHGIVNNYKLEPGTKFSTWFHYADSLKRKALWDYLEENNKKVLSLSWPVSAGANISYSLPEMTPAKPKIWNFTNFMRQVNLWFKYGNKKLATQAMLSTSGFTKSWFFGTQPDLDEAMIALLNKTLDQYNWDLALFHVYGMDDAKHIYGVNSSEAHSFLKLYDAFLGDLIAYVDSHTNSDQSITLMVTGDHSQKQVDKAVYLNHILKDMGLCSYDREGNLLSWKAYFHSGDGMAYLYIKDKANEQNIIERVSERLYDHPGVAKLINHHEMDMLGCGLEASLALDGAMGYGFIDNYYIGNDMDDNFVAPHNEKGLHGYLPTLPDYQTMFFAYGVDIKPTVIENMSIIDIAPTICHMLGIEQDTMDGKAIEEIFLN